MMGLMYDMIIRNENYTYNDIRFYIFNAKLKLRYGNSMCIVPYIYDIHVVKWFLQNWRHVILQLEIWFENLRFFIGVFFS